MKTPALFTPLKLLCTTLLVMATACGGGGGSKSKADGDFSKDPKNFSFQSKEKAKSLYQKIPARILERCGKAAPIDFTVTAPHHQSRAPWCEGFSSLRLLQEHQRAYGGSREALSIMDFVAHSSYKGGIPLFSAVNSTRAYENIQRTGTLRSEKDFPFDLEIFSVDNEKIIQAAFTNKSAFSTIETKKYTVKVDATIAAQEAYQDYREIPVSSFQQKNNTNPIQQIAIKPFNIHDEEYYGDENLHAGLDSLFARFEEGTIVNTSICADKLDKVGAKGIDESSRFDDKCGDHAVDFVTSRIENGRCEVQILNSWGEEWGDKGTLWVDLETLIEWMPVNSKTKEAQLDLTYLVARAQNSPIQNSFTDTNSNRHYVGETEGSIAHGKGSLTIGLGPTQLTGTFEHGNFKTGFGKRVRYFDDAPNVVESIEEGEWKDSVLVKGTTQNFNKKGELIYEYKGTLSEKFKFWTGSYYSLEENTGKKTQGVFNKGEWKSTHI